jgi:copper resistance protein D
MVRQILLMIHITLGVMWAGGVMFVGWGVFPATWSMSVATQRQFLIKLMKWTHHIFTLIGCGVVGTGILLGTVYGPIKEWQTIWSTTYGHIWLAALLIGIFSLLWGMFVGYREMMLLFHDKYVWYLAEKGKKELLIRGLIRLALLESVEVVGFLVLIILMVSF